jgi:hypothetical protein
VAASNVITSIRRIDAINPTIRNGSAITSLCDRIEICTVYSISTAATSALYPFVFL